MAGVRPWIAGAVAVLLAGCGALAAPEEPESAQPRDTAATAPVPPQPVAARQDTGSPAPSPSLTPAAAAPRQAPALPSAADARTPRALAAALLAAERAIRNPDVRGAALAAAGHEQQIAYRRLVRRPRWRSAVVESLPRRLRPAARRNILAGERLYGLVTPQPELPKWRIRRPAPAEELLGHYRRAGAAFDIPWPYLAAIHLVETRMGRIRGTSTAGAKGPMQFMPATWAAYGRGDINDNGDAIMAAARYLAANGAPANLRRALWHYNHSDRYVDAISAYARVMLDDPRTYRGYYHWQVYYLHVDGDTLLEVGYDGR